MEQFKQISSNPPPFERKFVNPEENMKVIQLFRQVASQPPSPFTTYWYVFVTFVVAVNL